MTSAVTVRASCSSTKEVKITGSTNEAVTLQDGEERTFYIYDDIEVNVKEVEKDNGDIEIIEAERPE